MTTNGSWPGWLALEEEDGSGNWENSCTTCVGRHHPACMPAHLHGGVAAWLLHTPRRHLLWRRRWRAWAVGDRRAASCLHCLPLSSPTLSLSSLSLYMLTTCLHAYFLLPYSAYVPPLYIYICLGLLYIPACHLDLVKTDNWPNKTAVCP